LQRIEQPVWLPPAKHAVCALCGNLTALWPTSGCAVIQD